MESYEIEIKDCCQSLQIIYKELVEAKVEGLAGKARQGEHCQFLVIMPEIAKGDVESGHNIFIDVEEWGGKQNDGPDALCGEVTFNFGYGHTHFGYGSGNPIIECAKDVAGFVKDLQNKVLFAYGIITPIGSIRSGYRNIPPADIDIKTDMEAAYIISYYRQNIYKEGMSSIPESLEMIEEIDKKLRAPQKKDKFCYVFWNEEQTITTLFDKKGEEGIQ